MFVSLFVSRCKHDEAATGDRGDDAADKKRSADPPGARAQRPVPSLPASFVLSPYIDARSAPLVASVAAAGLDALLQYRRSKAVRQVSLPSIAPPSPIPWRAEQVKTLRAREESGLSTSGPD